MRHAIEARRMEEDGPERGLCCKEARIPAVSKGNSHMRRDYRNRVFALCEVGHTENPSPC
jgi:hypothetical protein